MPIEESGAVERDAAGRDAAGLDVARRDVVVVGAGLSGLICGHWLQQQGYQTLILEKSRGLGGRIATRRVEGLPLDHGVPYLERQGIHTQRLIEDMAALGVVAPSSASVLSPGSSGLEPPVCIAPQGMTAIAKALAADLTIYRQHRVEQLTRQSDCWSLRVLAGEQGQTFTARAVVLALPAPQVLPLVRPFEAAGMAQLAQASEAVAFDPCFSVMAGYSSAVPDLPLGVRLAAEGGGDLRWIGFEPQKRDMARCAVVLQSSAQFAHQAIDALSPAEIANRLVAAAQSIQPIANLGSPNWTQTHRWRYAFCRQPHPGPCLVTQTPLPLACCGDWCGGSRLEDAARSGLAAAEAIAAALG